jgi:hypothetical protein
MKRSIERTYSVAASACRSFHNPAPADSRATLRTRWHHVQPLHGHGQLASSHSSEHKPHYYQKQHDGTRSQHRILFDDISVATSHSYPVLPPSYALRYPAAVPRRAFHRLGSSLHPQEYRRRDADRAPAYVYLTVAGKDRTGCPSFLVAHWNIAHHPQFRWGNTLGVFQSLRPQLFRLNERNV